MEEWRDVLGYEGLYKVSEYGVVKSVERYVNHKSGKRVVKERILSIGCHLFGYPIVQPSKGGKSKTFAVHKLVLEAFVGKAPKGMECRHLDGNPKNNHISNLKWGTHKENQQDMVLHCRSQKGEKQRIAKLNKAQIYLIKKVLDAKIVPDRIIAKAFNVTRSNINKIRNEYTWSWV